MSAAATLKNLKARRMAVTKPYYNQQNAEAERRAMAEGEYAQQAANLALASRQKAWAKNERRRKQEEEWRDMTPERRSAVREFYAGLEGEGSFAVSKPKSAPRVSVEHLGPHAVELLGQYRNPAAAAAARTATRRLPLQLRKFSGNSENEEEGEAGGVSFASSAAVSNPGIQNTSAVTDSGAALEDTFPQLTPTIRNACKAMLAYLSAPEILTRKPLGRLPASWVTASPEDKQEILRVIEKLYAKYPHMKPVGGNIRNAIGSFGGKKKKGTKRMPRK